VLIHAQSETLICDLERNLVTQSECDFFLNFVYDSLLNSSGYFSNSRVITPRFFYVDINWWWTISFCTMCEFWQRFLFSEWI